MHVYRLTGSLVDEPIVYLESHRHPDEMSQLLAYIIGYFEEESLDTALGTMEIAEILTELYGANRLPSTLGDRWAVEFDVLTHMELWHDQINIIKNMTKFHHKLLKKKLRHYYIVSNRLARKQLKHLFQWKRSPFSFVLAITRRSIIWNSIFIFLTICLFEVPLLFSDLDSETFLFVHLWIYGSLLLFGVPILYIYHYKNLVPLRMTFTDEFIEIRYPFRKRRWEVRNLELISWNICKVRRSRKASGLYWITVDNIEICFLDPYDEILEITREHLRYMPITLEELSEQLNKLYRKPENN